eukprot:1175541-Prorocentrum_minimum.AAC.1
MFLPFTLLGRGRGIRHPTCCGLHVMCTTSHAQQWLSGRREAMKHEYANVLNNAYANAAGATGLRFELAKQGGIQ